MNDSGNVGLLFGNTFRQIFGKNCTNLFSPGSPNYGNLDFCWHYNELEGRDQDRHGAHMVATNNFKVLISLISYVNQRPTSWALKRLNLFLMITCEFNFLSQHVLNNIFLVGRFFIAHWMLVPIEIFENSYLRMIRKFGLIA